MVKAVIDTNVIVSGLIRPGNPRKIVEAFKHGVFTLVMSPLIFEEIVTVLGRPRFSGLIDNDGRKDILLLLETSGESVIPVEAVSLCRDPADNHILACAKNAKADFIVSGDKDLLSLKAFHNIPIISPREFLTRL